MKVYQLLSIICVLLFASCIHEKDKGTEVVNDEELCNMYNSFILHAVSERQKIVAIEHNNNNRCSLVSSIANLERDSVEVILNSLNTGSNVVVDSIEISNKYSSWETFYQVESNQVKLELMEVADSLTMYTVSKIDSYKLYKGDDYYRIKKDEEGSFWLQELKPNYVSLEISLPVKIIEPNIFIYRLVLYNYDKREYMDTYCFAKLLGLDWVDYTYDVYFRFVLSSNQENVSYADESS